MEVMSSNVWPAGFHRADFEKCDKIFTPRNSGNKY